MILIKDNIHFNTIDISQFNQEALMITFKHRGREIALATIYNKPLKHMDTDLIPFILTTYATNIIVGDFNARHAFFGDVGNTNTSRRSSIQHNRNIRLTGSQQHTTHTHSRRHTRPGSTVHQHAKSCLRLRRRRIHWQRSLSAARQASHCRTAKKYTTTEKQIGTSLGI